MDPNIRVRRTPLAGWGPLPIKCSCQKMGGINHPKIHGLDRKCRGLLDLQCHLGEYQVHFELSLSRKCSDLPYNLQVVGKLVS